MSQIGFDIDEILENFHRWLEAQSMEPLAAYAERLTDQVPDSTPLGMVLCLADNQDSLLAQTLAALTAGNGVLWPRAQPEDPVQTQALRVGLPSLVKSQVTLTDWHPSTDAVPDPLPQAVLHTGAPDALAYLQQQTCQWPNHPVTIISCREDIERFRNSSGAIATLIRRVSGEGPMTPAGFPSHGTGCPRPATAWRGRARPPAL